MKKKQLYIVLSGIGLACILPSLPVFAAEGMGRETESVVQQNKKVKVSGVVKDQTGASLPGVTILIKGTKTGTATDIDGKFSLEVPEGAILVASFVGMKDQEVKADPGKLLIVVLSPENQMIDEVVVTGYQKIDRKLFTGAAARVDMEDMKLGGETDIAKKLEGQVAGVSVQNVSSTFGTAPKIRVRGASSIYGTQKPLWVVDGIVLEDAVNVSEDELNSGDLSTLVSSGVAGLNTDDIASIQILKDVSATALYGARAMNGVIVVTTRKGRSGKVEVNYSTNISIKPVPVYNDYNILNSADQMSVNRELYEKGWITVARTQSAVTHGPYGKMFELIGAGKLNWVDNNTVIDQFLRKYETANTDWFDILFKPGVQQQHTLSFSAGSDRNSLYASVGYLHDAGWTIADDVDRYTALIKGSFKLRENFTMTAQTNLSYRKQQLSGVSNSSNSSGDGVSIYTGRVSRSFDNNPFMYALQTSRSIRPYDEKGNLEFFRKNYCDFNIVDELQKNITGVTVRDMSFLTDLNYQILPELTATVRLSARYFQSERTREIHENSNQANAYRAGTRPGDSEIIRRNNSALFEKPDETTGIRYSILPEGGIYESYEDLMENYYFNGNLGWNPIFAEIHRFTFMAGTEVRYVNRTAKSMLDYGHFFDSANSSLMNENLGIYLSMLGSSLFSGPHYDYDRFAAFFLNVGYSFRDKYTFNGTVRYDGSNRLGHSRDARWLPTWNLSAKWAVREEAFMQDAGIISTLNLRATYGLNATMGNASNSTLVMLSNYQSHTLHPSAGEQQIQLNSLANKDLTWEKQRELNIGFDLGLWDNDLNLEFNYYIRKGFDLIGNYKTNGVGGQLNKVGNISDMDSHGVEIDLNVTPLRAGDFKWNVNFNYSYHKSKVKNLLSLSWGGRATSVFGIPVEGGPVRGIYSTHFAGLDHQGIPTFTDRKGEKQYYIDLQTNDLSDFVFSGNLEPTGNAGMTHTFTYKGLSLSVLLSGQFGHKKRIMQDFSYYYEDSEALSSHLKNRWRVAGDEAWTDIPAILDYSFFNKHEMKSYYALAYNLYGMSDRWLADASFIRLKNLALNYSLPRQWLGASGLQSVKVGLQATNLALLWVKDRKKLAGEDPEFMWTGGTTMPVSKQYTITLSVSF